MYNDDQHRSLILATQKVLAYYGIAFGLSIITENDSIEVTNQLEPSIKVVARGDRDTWPIGLPSIIQFDNGLYAYLQDAGSRQIIDPRTGQPGDASPHGNPVQWVTFGQITISEPLTEVSTIYVENTVDGISYKKLTSAPQLMYVNKQDGTDKVAFGGSIANFRDFISVPGTHKPYSSEVRIMGTAHHPVIPAGQDFFMDMDDWGNFTGTGMVATLQGYKLGDLSDTKPPVVHTNVLVVNTKPVIPIQRSITDVSPVVPRSKAVSESLVSVIPDDPTYYHFRYLNDEHEPVRYKVMNAVRIFDYTKKAPDIVLIRGKTTRIIGTFQWQGRVFLLPVVEDPQTKTEYPLFQYMYGIPEFTDRVRVIEELPDFSTIVTEAQTSPAERVAIAKQHGNQVVYFLSHPGELIVEIATRIELAVEKLFKRGNK